MFLKAVYFVVLVTIITALYVNIFIEEPTFKNLTEEAEHYTNSNQLLKAESCYFQILQHDSTNVKAHYNYINSHFALPNREKVGRHHTKERDDKSIHDFYVAKTLSKDTSIQDIGWYGLGLYSSNIENYLEAGQCYKRVKNLKLPHLNNSIGFIYKYYGNLDSAEIHFKKEIENNAAISAAYTNLIDLLIVKNRFAELNSLLSDSATSKYFSYRDIRLTYLLQGNILEYSTTIVRFFISSIYPIGFISALLVMCCWIFYLRQIDIFESEKWIFFLLTLVLGMIFSFGTMVINDSIHSVTNFDLTGNIFNDFTYSVVGIGAVEELVKFLPFLIILLFTNQVNEPIDYIIYSSLSALGFSFIENILYFQQGGLHLIHSRAFASSVEHMFLSSVIGYGLMLSRYKLYNNIFIAFIYSYLLASFFHGFYDFWLISKAVSSFSIISTFVLYISLYVYNSFINNSINNSIYFNSDTSIDDFKIIRYLFYSASLIVLVEYVSISYVFGHSTGNYQLLSSIFTSGWTCYFLIMSLSSIRLKQGNWEPLLGFGVFCWEKNIDNVHHKEQKVEPRLDTRKGKKQSKK